MTLTLTAGIALMRSSTARTHHGTSWHNQCGSFVCCMVSGIDASGNGIGASRPTAREALAASGPIVSTDPAKAAPGDIGWWSNGTGDGHVAVYVGSGLWAMASDAVTEGGTVWGEDSGTITLPRYNSLRPDMRWVGFTHDFVGQTFKPAPAPVKPGRTFYTLATGKPNPVFWRRFEWWAGIRAGLTGTPTKAAWKAIQTRLAHEFGYRGDIDGEPLKLTYQALQRLAMKGGYTGPIDGDPQRFTWRGVARYLNGQ